MPLDRNDRPVIARREDALLDRALECIVMGDDQPIGFARSDMEFLGNRLARNPDLCRSVVDCVTDAPYAGGRLGRVTPGADLGEIERRSGFNVPI